MNFDESFASLVAGSFHRLPEEIKENMRFKKDLKADYVAFLEMVLNLECFYRCPIDDEELRMVETVGDLKTILREKIPNTVGKSS